MAKDVENFESYDVVFVGYPKMEYGFDCVLCVSCSKRAEKGTVCTKDSRNCVYC